MVTSAIIIGGGVAGASAPLQLAKRQIPVTLLERERSAHDKVCGEFLSTEACQELTHIGMDLASLGGLAIDRVRVCLGTQSAQCALPFPAWSISRRVLDEAMLSAAALAGAEVVRGARVTGLRGKAVVASDGEREAGAVFLATGKHDLRGLPRARGSHLSRHDYVGLKMHWELPAAAAPELGTAIELVLFDGGYAGLQPIGGGKANLCLVVRRGHLAGDVDALFERLLREPALASKLAHARPLFSRPLAISNLPYGFVHRPEADAAPALWRLGDQAAMTASLTGDGMAMALRSARMATDHLRAGKSSESYHHAMAMHCQAQVRRAMRLQRLAELPFALRGAMLLARLYPGLLARAAAATRLPPLAA